jgi:polysaccharide biosynthesis/export protein
LYSTRAALGYNLVNGRLRRGLRAQAQFDLIGDMRTAIIPVLALFAGFGFGVLAAGQDQGAQQTPPKKEAVLPKPADGVTDPAAMAGDKAASPKPTMIGGAPVGKTYVIGATDVLQIWVLEQAGISGAYTVRADGIISVPMVGGDINVSGMTTGQVETAIADRLKANQIINDPSVTVGVAASHSRKYYISGQVNRTGEVDLVVPTRVSEALANAGGFKDFAKLKSIRIIREHPDGTVEKFKYNEKDVSHGKNLKQNIYLEPGDRIYVD